VQILALCAQSPDRGGEAVTIGRGSKGGGLAVSHLVGLPEADALTRLNDLVAVYRIGLTTPLPIPPKTASVSAEKRLGGVSFVNALAFAGKAWRQTGQTLQGECTDADHQRVWGDVPIEALLSDADPTDTAWPDEPHRFGQLSRRVWTPLLDAETVDTL